MANLFRFAAALGMALTACGGAPEAQVPSRPPPTHASLPSAARADWPCGIDELAGDDLLEVVFTYDGPAACRIPLDLVADGVLGCPSRMQKTHVITGRVADEALYRYDVQGRLIGARYPWGSSAFAWDGDQLLARTDTIPKMEPVTRRYLARDDRIELLLDAEEPAAVLRLDGAHLVSYEARDREPTTYAWDGPRLRRVERASSFQRPIYECEGAAP